MKTFPIICGLGLLIASASGQTATEVDSPKMVALGIRMIEFRARPNAGQVAIVRIEENHSEHGLEIYDTITHNPMDELVGHVLLQDLAQVYPDQKGKWGITFKGGGGIREGFQLLDSKVAKDRADFRFRAIEGGKAVDYSFRFSVIVLSYEEAKKLHPKLPQLAPGGWTYSDMLKRQEPNPPNPHKRVPRLSDTI
jgi:hypothetical protein